MTKNIFVRKKTDVRETGQSGPAQFFLATVASVTAAEGVTIIPDGQTEAVAKKYKVLTAGTAPPSVGDRVVVMRHSGTCVILGAIGEPEDMDADARITDVENEITGIDTELGKKVNKAGDTMTGSLTLSAGNAGIYENTTAYEVGVPPSSDFYTIGLRNRDKNGTVFTAFNSALLSNGNIAARMIATKGSISNYLQLVIDSNNNLSILVSNAAAWRKALGLGNASGALPITVGQGGTGATSAAGHAVFAGPNSSSAAAPSFRALVAADIPNLDASKITAGTLPIGRGGTGNTGTATVTTLANIATAGPNTTLTEASFSSWGKLAMIFVKGITTASISSSAVLFTIVSGKRPVSYAPGQIGRAPSYCVLIGPDGQATLGGSLSSGTEFSCAAVYLLP